MSTCKSTPNPKPSNLAQWRNASRVNPCPICDHDDWCSIHVDGDVACCKRAPEARADAGEPKTDSVGTPYWTYHRRDDGNWHSGAPPRGTTYHPPEREHHEPEQSGERWYSRPTAAPEDRDIAYRALLDACSLHGNHEQQLMQQRGMSREQIERAGYKSWPNALDEQTAAIHAVRLALLQRVAPGVVERRDAALELHRAANDGKEPDAETMKRITSDTIGKGNIEAVNDRLLTIPGFWMDADKHFHFGGMPGILLPIRDTAGRIVALQVRLEIPAANGARYLPPVAPLKVEAGAKTGAAIPKLAHHPVGFPERADKIVITEGAFKAEIATANLKVPVIGIPDVGSWRTALPTIAQMGCMTVAIAFDADSRRKAVVCGCMTLLADELAARGITAEVMSWDEACGKGIDDVLVAGHGEKIKTLSGRAAWDVIAERRQQSHIGPHAGVEARRVLADVLERVQADPAHAFDPRVVGALAALDQGSVEYQRITMAIEKLVKNPTRYTALKGQIENVREAGDSAEAPGEATIVTILHGLDLFQTSTGRVYASVEQHAIAVDSDSFWCKMSKLYHDECGKVLPRDTLRSGVAVVRGEGLEVRVAPIRFGGDASRIVIDLADGENRAIVITRERIEVAQPPIAFARPDGTLPLPVPDIPRSNEECQSALSAFRKLLGIAETNRGTWASVIAFILSQCRPMETDGELTEYSGLRIQGPEGTGKTTFARLVRRATDPREPDVVALPGDTHDLAITCENVHTLALDNLSSIDQDRSDALCRVATGDGFLKRSLYTDRDLAVFRGSNPVIITSIADVMVSPDLYDRYLVAAIERPQKRVPKKKLMREFRALHPKLLGALCYLIQAALKSAAEVVVPNDIRMQEACAWAAGAEVAAGLEDGSIVMAYRAAKDDAINKAADDPLVAAIEAFLPEVISDPLTGATEPTATKEVAVKELHGALTVLAYPDGKRIPKHWPCNGQQLRACIDRLLGTLERRGIKIDFGDRYSNRKGEDRVRTWILTRRFADSDTPPQGVSPSVSDGNACKQAVKCGSDTPDTPDTPSNLKKSGSNLEDRVRDRSHSGQDRHQSVSGVSPAPNLHGNTGSTPDTPPRHAGDTPPQGVSDDWIRVEFVSAGYEDIDDPGRGPCRRMTVQLLAHDGRECWVFYTAEPGSDLLEHARRAWNVPGHWGRLEQKVCAEGTWWCVVELRPAQAAAA